MPDSNCDDCLTLRLNPPVYEAAEGRLLISWAVLAGHTGMRQNGFEVVYRPAHPGISSEDAFHVFCGSLLPHFAHEKRTVRILTHWMPPAAVQDAWRRYLAALGIENTVEFGPAPAEPGGALGLRHFRLHIDGGGLPAPNDSRILNARVFSIECEIARVREGRPDHGTEEDILSGSALFLGDGWHAFEKYGEDRFRWFENDAEITVCAPIDAAVRISLSIEPGPGVGSMPFVLQIRGASGASIPGTEVAGRQTVSFQLDAPEQPANAGLGTPVPRQREPRVGLFFGGGVESLSLLSLIKDSRPMLLVVEGPSWMNNDYRKGAIKDQLHKSLEAAYGFTFLRACTTIRPLIPKEELYVNRYVLGSLMYHTLAPLMRHYGVETLFLAAEHEFCQLDETFNQSIHPRFVQKVSLGQLPVILSPLNGVPKVELLDHLYSSDPELCRHLFCCFYNSEIRWCGTCGKCRRISAFCEVIGIPREWIGMQEGVDHTPETSYSTAPYWKNLESFRRKKAPAVVSNGYLQDGDLL